MRRPHMIAATFLGAVSLGLILISLSYYVERPTTLRVAVSTADQDDVDLVAAMAKLAKHEHKGLRFHPVPVSGDAAAAQALERDDADLAVVRPDVAMPDKGGTVVLLHKDIAVLVAPGGSQIANVGDLADKKLGVVDATPGDDKLLEATLGQYDLAPETVSVIRLKPEDVSEAVKSKAVDAIFAVGQTTSKALQTSVRALAKAGEGPPVFLPVAEAGAIAERVPAYETGEIVKGAFGGSPPRPADDVDTLAITTRLVASADLSDGTVGTLTRFLLSERVALAALAPIASRMTAPSTDKGAPIPVHPGTAAYIDDEEETFLDKYSDFIYIGAMVLGVFASGLTAIVGRLGSSGARPVEDYVARLLAMLKEVRVATNARVVDDLEVEVDVLIAEALGSLRGWDEHRARALHMAVDQVRAAIQHRREQLAREAPPTADNDDAGLHPFEPMLVTRRIDLKGDV